MNNKTRFAPVYIPTLCRDKHFVLAVESLKKNGWAKYTDVFVALDYPIKDSHWDGYRKICDYLENGDFSAFSSFNVIKREKNIGSLANIDTARDQIIEKYDRWIMAEDDIEFAPVFLEYMNKCLDLYEDDPEVFAINGYAYPVSYEHSAGSNVVKQYTTVSEWGIGYWKDKYLEAENKIRQGFLADSFESADKNGILAKMSNSRRCDYINFALSANDDPLYTHMTDISMGIYCNLTGKCVITPVISKTRNHGFDGTGLYCGKIENAKGMHSMDFDYEHQEMDSSQSIEIIPDTGNNAVINMNRMNDFLYEPAQRVRKIRLMYNTYKIIGKKQCTRIYRALKAAKYRLFGAPDRTSY